MCLLISLKIVQDILPSVFFNQNYPTWYFAFHKFCCQFGIDEHWHLKQLYIFVLLDFFNMECTRCFALYSNTLTRLAHTWSHDKQILKLKSSDGHEKSTDSLTSFKGGSRNNCIRGWGWTFIFYLMGSWLNFNQGCVGSHVIL